jgi:hypothetical protein
VGPRGSRRSFPMKLANGGRVASLAQITEEKRWPMT